MRIIDKRGPLMNPADRDHCLQYMVAVALLEGDLCAEHYDDEHARDPRIDRLRQMMEVVENPQYSRDYLDPTKRSIGNAVTVFFADGSATDRVEAEYPLGHARRRSESLPHLERKLWANLASRFSAERCQAAIGLLHNPDRLDSMPIGEFMGMFAAMKK